jgi:hypothetical protein
MRTAIILFTLNGKSYRMRLPRIHVHPGDREQFEVASKDMTNQSAWSPVVNGTDAIPSGEWLARRALWHLIESNNRPITCMPECLVFIDLGELEI